MCVGVRQSAAYARRASKAKQTSASSRRTADGTHRRAARRGDGGAGAGAGTSSCLQAYIRRITQDGRARDATFLDSHFGAPSSFECAEERILSSWAPLLNVWDAVLEDFERTDPLCVLLQNQTQLRRGQAGAASEALVVAVLRASYMLLSRVSQDTRNIQVYNSLDRMVVLLGSENDDILRLALKIIRLLLSSHSEGSMASAKTHAQQKVSPDLVLALFTLSQGWGGEQSNCGLLQSCVSDGDDGIVSRSSHANAVPSRGCRVAFPTLEADGDHGVVYSADDVCTVLQAYREYCTEPSGSSMESQLSLFAWYLEDGSRGSRGRSGASSHSSPLPSFSLRLRALIALRSARAFQDYARARRAHVSIRLLALISLLSLPHSVLGSVLGVGSGASGVTNSSWQGQDVVLSLIYQEPELVGDLFALARFGAFPHEASAGRQDERRGRAQKQELHALAIRSVQCLSMICTLKKSQVHVLCGVSSHHGALPTLIRNAIARLHVSTLSQSGSHRNSEDGPPGENAKLAAGSSFFEQDIREGYCAGFESLDIEYVHALLTLLSSVMSPSASNLDASGILHAITSILKLPLPCLVRLLRKSVALLELYFGITDRHGANLFCNLGGLSIIVQRITELVVGVGGSSTLDLVEKHSLLHSLVLGLHGEQNELRDQERVASAARLHAMFGEYIRRTKALKSSASTKNAGVSGNESEVGDYADVNMDREEGAGSDAVLSSAQYKELQDLDEMIERICLALRGECRGNDPMVGSPSVAGERAAFLPGATADGDEIEHEGRFDKNLVMNRSIMHASLTRGFLNYSAGSTLWSLFSLLALAYRFAGRDRIHELLLRPRGNGSPGSGFERALRDIIARPFLFGTALFSASIRFLTDAINAEPTIVPALLTARVDVSFLRAVQLGLPPNAEAQAVVLPMLTCLCLSMRALENVARNESNVIAPFLVRLISWPTVNSMHVEGCYAVASALDELVRHVPQLRAKCYSAIILCLQRLLEVLQCEDKSAGDGLAGGEAVAAAAMSVATTSKLSMAAKAKMACVALRITAPAISNMHDDHESDGLTFGTAVELLLSLRKVSVMHNKLSRASPGSSGTSPHTSTARAAQLVPSTAMSERELSECWLASIRAIGQKKQLVKRLWEVVNEDARILHKELLLKEASEQNSELDASEAMDTGEHHVALKVASDTMRADLCLLVGLSKSWGFSSNFWWKHSSDLGSADVQAGDCCAFIALIGTCERLARVHIARKYRGLKVEEMTNNTDSNWVSGLSGASVWCLKSNLSQRIDPFLAGSVTEQVYALVEKSDGMGPERIIPSKDALLSRVSSALRVPQAMACDIGTRAGPQTTLHTYAEVLGLGRSLALLTSVCEKLYVILARGVSAQPRRMGGGDSSRTGASRVAHSVAKTLARLVTNHISAVTWIVPGVAATDEDMSADDVTVNERAVVGWEYFHQVLVCLKQVFFMDGYGSTRVTPMCKPVALYEFFMAGGHVILSATITRLVAMTPKNLNGQMGFTNTLDEVDFDLVAQIPVDSMSALCEAMEMVLEIREVAEGSGRDIAARSRRAGDHEVSSEEDTGFFALQPSGIPLLTQLPDRNSVANMARTVNGIRNYTIELNRFALAQSAATRALHAFGSVSQLLAFCPAIYSANLGSIGSGAHGTGPDSIVAGIWSRKDLHRAACALAVEMMLEVSGTHGDVVSSVLDEGRSESLQISERRPSRLFRMNGLYENALLGLLNVIFTLADWLGSPTASAVPNGGAAASSVAPRSAGSGTELLNTEFRDALGVSAAEGDDVNLPERTLPNAEDESADPLESDELVGALAEAASPLSRVHAMNLLRPVVVGRQHDVQMLTEMGFSRERVVYTMLRMGSNGGARYTPARLEAVMDSLLSSTGESDAHVELERRWLNNVAASARAALNGSDPMQSQARPESTLSANPPAQAPRGSATGTGLDSQTPPAPKEILESPSQVAYRVVSSLRNEARAIGESVCIDQSNFTRLAAVLETWIEMQESKKGTVELDTIRIAWRGCMDADGKHNDNLSESLSDTGSSLAAVPADAFRSLVEALVKHLVFMVEENIEQIVKQESDQQQSIGLERDTLEPHFIADMICLAEKSGLITDAQRENLLCKLVSSFPVSERTQLDHQTSIKSQRVRMRLVHTISILSHQGGSAMRIALRTALPVDRMLGVLDECLQPLLREDEKQSIEATDMDTSDLSYPRPHSFVFQNTVFELAAHCFLILDAYIRYARQDDAFQMTNKREDAMVQPAVLDVSTKAADRAEGGAKGQDLRKEKRARLLTAQIPDLGEPDVQSGAQNSGIASALATATSSVLEHFVAAQRSVSSYTQPFREIVERSNASCELDRDVTGDTSACIIDRVLMRCMLAVDTNLCADLQSESHARMQLAVLQCLSSLTLDERASNNMLQGHDHQEQQTRLPSEECRLARLFRIPVLRRFGLRTYAEAVDEQHEQNLLFGNPNLNASKVESNVAFARPNMFSNKQQASSFARALLRTIIRNVAEDRGALLCAMQNEIRSLFAHEQQRSVFAEQHRADPNRRATAVPLGALVNSLGPVLVRDIPTFLAALVSTVRIRPGTGRLLYLLEDLEPNVAEDGAPSEPGSTRANRKVPTSMLPLNMAVANGAKSSPTASGVTSFVVQPEREQRQKLEETCSERGFQGEALGAPPPRVVQVVHILLGLVRVEENAHDWTGRSVDVEFVLEASVRLFVLVVLVELVELYASRESGLVSYFAEESGASEADTDGDLLERIIRSLLRQQQQQQQQQQTRSASTMPHRTGSSQGSQQLHVHQQSSVSSVLRSAISENASALVRVVLANDDEWMASRAARTLARLVEQEAKKSKPSPSTLLALTDCINSATLPLELLKQLVAMDMPTNLVMSLRRLELSAGAISPDIIRSVVRCLETLGFAAMIDAGAVAAASGGGEVGLDMDF
ncbi:hypothetical protein FVE85_8562 [Porphyridium purpureum]|uniref:DUF913 domain-containing protein n=1 Tax=Porphyridium purpureum TaxID=35688 RepID=A0A5J4YRS1_PORPP|nr:hypothetical protein FVE85_8562 [Porphyridium purpureum]|eukprot:POR7686..scf296_7